MAQSLVKGKPKLEYFSKATTRFDFWIDPIISCCIQRILQKFIEYSRSTTPYAHMKNLSCDEFN